MFPHSLLCFFLLGLAGLVLADGVSIYFQVPIPIPSIQLLPPPPPGHSANTTPLVAAYYPDWAPSSFPPSKIDFEKVDLVDFAFAMPDKTFNLTWDDGESTPSLLRDLVTAAHSKGKKVKLSIGGWDGSQYFSPAVKSNTSRSTFANNILSVYQSFSLDGIDIDWEYPGTEGEQGNAVSPEDTSNLLEFFKILRKVLPEEAYITATSTDSTFMNSVGNPSVDMSAFAEVLDWVLLMNYDVNGGGIFLPHFPVPPLLTSQIASSHPGPNAPLSDGCHNSEQPAQNAESGFTSWTEAGFPASKLMLGVPSYGYISKSNVTKLTERSLKVTSEDGSSQVQFRTLVSEGALQIDHQNSSSPWNTTYTSSGGFTRYWDGCSSTPFLQSSKEDQVITYDDPQSLYMKAAFVRNSGMLGVNLFDIHGDTDGFDLLDSLRYGLGLP
jgi:chitinase